MADLPKLGLSALLAKRKAMEDGTTPDTSGSPAQPVGQVADVQAAASAPQAQVESKVEEPAQKPRLGLGGLNFAGIKSPTPKPAPPEADKSLDLSDLADSLIGEEEAALRAPKRMSGFADETPATAPIRTLPEDCEKQMKLFVELMDNVYTVLDDPEMLGNMIRNIMIELKANPMYDKMVTTTDIRTWVRAMRETMGLARIKKQETKAKRGSGKKASGRAADPDMALAMAELGVNFDDL